MAQPAPAGSTNSATDVVGSTTPRIWTPPLRELTRHTSWGYDLIDFAESIGWPLDPWECWAAIHLGELLPDGRPRFRFVLILVARQNGKTTLCRIIILYWLFIERHALILGTSTSRDTAKVSWRETVKMAEAADVLADELAPLHTRETIGEETFFLDYVDHVDGCDRAECECRPGRAEYRFAAPNRRAGRSFTIQRVLLDELREHQNEDTWDAAINAGNAVDDFQAIAITNQGDSRSVVLDAQREAALEFIETGNGDPRTFLAEWSAPNGADPTDPLALAQANPNLNRRIMLDNIMGQAIKAKRAGGEKLARFRTEVMCQRVTLLDPAIDPELWDAAGVDPAEALDLAEHRRAVALCLDVSLDGAHATLVAAALVDGLVHLDVVKTWQGFGCTRALRADLPGLVRKIRPRALGWFPNGPAAAVAASLKGGPDRSWPPRRVDVAELSAETAAVCMGFAEQVATGQARHPRDPLLTQHVSQTQRLKRGDSWVYTRQGSGPVDATYAAAGAAHLARTLPAPLAPVQVEF
jgi:hypothetical protein